MNDDSDRRAPADDVAAGSERDVPADRAARSERAGRGGGAARRRAARRRLWLIIIAAVVILALVAVAAVVYVEHYFSEGALGPEVSVTIAPGSTLHEIAVALEKAGVVRRARAFELRADADGYGEKFLPGTYRLHVNEPYDRLVAALLDGPAVETVKVTIPEGLNARQTAALLAEKLPGFQATQYVDLTLVHPLPFTLDGFASGESLEGMLFPATYEVRPDVTPRQFVRMQLEAFSVTLDGIDLRKAHAHNLTDYDVVILGSMVEREIQVAAERSLASAVMWNRLHLDMPLQIDATVQYALPEYKEQLTYDDLKVESPYNTYLHTGLPPTPIANPGAAALRAAAHPAAVGYLYYVARNDGSGRHYFSSDYEQFLKDKEKAQQ
jgi:UPF0755 protein